MCKCQCGGSQQGGRRTRMECKSSGSLSVPMETQHPSSASLYQQHTWTQHAEAHEAEGTGAQLRQERKKSFAKLLASPPLFISTKHFIYMKLVKQMNKEEYAEEQGFLKYSKRCTLVYDFFGYDSISFHQDQIYIKKHQFIKDTVPLKTTVILWRCSIILWNGVFVKVKGSLIPDQAKFRDILKTFQKWNN